MSILMIRHVGELALLLIGATLAIDGYYAARRRWCAECCRAYAVFGTTRHRRCWTCWRRHVKTAVRA